MAKKMLPVILRSDEPFKIKMEAFFHLTNNLAYVLMIFLALLLLPNLFERAYIAQEQWMPAASSSAT